MDFQTAMTEALKSSGLSPQEVSDRANVSLNTVKNLRSGFTKRPMRLTEAALRNAIPGLSELLDGAVGA